MFVRRFSTSLFWQSSLGQWMLIPTSVSVLLSRESCCPHSSRYLSCLKIFGVLHFTVYRKSILYSASSSHYGLSCPLIFFSIFFFSIFCSFSGLSTVWSSCAETFSCSKHYYWHFWCYEDSSWILKVNLLVFCHHCCCFCFLCEYLKGDFDRLMDFIIPLIIRNITMLLLKFYFWDFAQTYFYLILLTSYKRISPVQ